MENKIDDKVLPIPMLGKEIDRFEGDTFYIAEHEYGALFHVYNSMDLIIRKGHTSAFESIVDLVRNKELYSTLSKEDMENVRTYAHMLAIVLTMPLYMFPATKEGLFGRAYRTAADYLIELNEKIENAELQPEDVDANIAFEESTIAAERLLEKFKEEGQ